MHVASFLLGGGGGGVRLFHWSSLEGAKCPSEGAKRRGEGVGCPPSHTRELLQLLHENGAIWCITEVKFLQSYGLFFLTRGGGGGGGGVNLPKPP